MINVVNRPAASPPEGRLRIAGNTSSSAMVDDANRQALAVDINAASAAAATNPLTPGGSTACAMAAKAPSVLANCGSTSLPAMPINAPATPYSTQYTPAPNPA
ncbi:hypothetical protein D3C80_1357740 [compost metagenome]